MNEIPSAVPVVAPIKSAPTSAATGTRLQKNGKDVPSATQDTTTPNVSLKEMQDHVEAAVAQMNQYIQSTQRDLHFSYDKAAGETVVKVLDRTTQEVIRQIPDETFLKLAQTKDANGNFQLLSAQA